MNKCKFDNCEKEAVANGLCSNHNNYYYQAGNEIGVYKLKFKNSNKLYIGFTSQGFDVRKSKHKNELTKGLKESGKKLLLYFNELCETNKELTREEVFCQFIELEEIFHGRKFIPVEIDEHKFEILHDKESQRASYPLNLSENEDIKKAIKEVVDFFRRQESRLISHYKEEDIVNGTDYCLNDYD
jgi:predicted GIY-YIG superfamily endonuclease